MISDSGDLALVLGGGGARAAYQVGFLRALGRMFPDLQVPILTGVSAGAICAAFLANHPGSLREASEELAELWSKLTVERVFKSDTGSLASNVFRWSVRLISGGVRIAPPTRGMVDTSPLRDFLLDVFKSKDGSLPGVERNLASGKLRSLAITTTKYATNQSISWVQSGVEGDWVRPQRRSVHAKIRIEHVLASCALPIFFPAIQIGEDWHGDGGIRLTTPLAPALHLGAQRLIAISTRYEHAQGEIERPKIEGYPPPAMILGVMLSSIFLDMLDQDAMNMQRLNELLAELPPEKHRSLRPAGLLLLRPSQDIGRLASAYEPTLPPMFRFLTRGLGTRETQRPDSLSMVLFQPEYAKRLIDIGQADAERRADEIRAFVSGESRPAIAQTGFWRI